MSGGVVAAVTQTAPLINGLTSSVTIIPRTSAATASLTVSQTQPSQPDEAVMELLAQDLIFDRRRITTLGKENISRYVWL